MKLNKLSHDIDAVCKAMQGLSANGVEIRGPEGAVPLSAIAKRVQAAPEQSSESGPDFTLN